MRRNFFRASLALFAAAATFGAAACSDAAGEGAPTDTTAPDGAPPVLGSDATVGAGERPRRDASWLGGEDAAPPPPRGPLPELTALASTSYSACAIGVDGSLWCWGDGQFWTLGWLYGGLMEDPVRIGHATDWATVAVAEQAVCATKTNGSLWCWGSDIAALGIGGSESVIDPFQTGSDYDWKLVRVERGYGCGLKTSGELFCWGRNESGRLGLGIDDSSYVASVPRRVGSAKWKALALNGFDNACGVKVDGSLWCWGSADGFNWSEGDYRERPSPEQIGTVSDWVEVEGGSDGFCALREDRSLWCWGDNGSWQAGTDQDDFGRVFEPRQVMPGTSWQAVRAGWLYACAVDSASALWCWGLGIDGQLGNGNTGGPQLPTRVGTASDWSFYGGTSPLRESLCAKRSDGSRWCWGKNHHGVLGDGTHENRLVPTLVP